MTEKSYGGNTGISKGKLVIAKNTQELKLDKKPTKTLESEEDDFDAESYIKSGNIAKEVIKYAKSIIKKDTKLLEIAEKIEAKIKELGAVPAFPVNLSINEIAAHYTPTYNDETLASGLIKADIGVAVNGAIADTAFSLDLENSEENKKLILAAENALKSALNYIKSTKEIKLNEIGREIHREITNLGFSPVRNLSGHELSQYMIHAGITIPNYDNNSQFILEDGAYAIEPFATSGIGIVYDGKPSEIYKFIERAGVRDSLAKEIMNFIEQEYKTLPFTSRWLVKKFGTRALISLRLMEQAGIVSRYPQLVEKSKSIVSQAEHSFIFSNGKVTITTG